MTESRIYSGPHFTIGTIGAAGHGKTTLLRAILRVQSARGKADYSLYNDLFTHTESSEIIVAEYQSTNHHYTHIDCPGGDEYTENMVTTIAQLDCTILVVAEDAGLRGETYEHVRLAREAGIRALIVYMNKCDMIVDPEMRDYLEQDIRALLNEHGFDGNNTPVIPGSALSAWETGNSNSVWVGFINDLIEAIDQATLNLMSLDDYIPQSRRT